MAIRNGRRSILFALAGHAALAVICICALAGTPDSPSGTTPLPTSFKFSVGDDPQWSSPAYNDADWPLVRVPAGWESQEAAPSGTLFGWYRLEFRIPHGLSPEGAAVCLGRIGDADEVYLNGVKIGGEGVVGDRFVEATKVVRLYRLPAHLVRPDDQNLLAIRVMNTWARGGIFDGPLLIGDRAELLSLKMAEEHRVKMVEVVFLTFFGIFLGFCGVSWIKGIRENEYTFFGLFLLLCGLVYISDSLLFYEAGFKTPFVQKANAALFTLIPGVFAAFVSSLYGVKISFLVRAILAVSLLLSAVFLVGMTVDSYPYLLAGFMLILAASAVASARTALWAFKRRMKESGAALTAVGVMVTGAVILAGEGLDLIVLPEVLGDSLSAFAIPALLGCMTYALIVRTVRAREQIRTLSGRILAAHEEERKRVARELHDGVGQSLLAVKLNLNMIAKSAENETNRAGIAEVIDEISGSIQELRDVAMELRPAYLERLGIADALRWYGKKLQNQTGIVVTVDASDGFDGASMPQRTKDNVYRICQEALANVLKHASATSVDLALRTGDGFLSLVLKDDGIGFDPAKAAHGDKGIGLSTMRERTELLGGIFSVASSPDTGTTITVRVPIDDRNRD